MISAVIVAAGKGTRMGPGVDKLFLDLGGIPLVAHTWRRFDSIATIDEIVLVVRSGLQASFVELAAQIQARKPFRFAEGGQERQDSVWNGLQAVSPGTEIVLIQDGARPFTSEKVILDTIQAARDCGAAVAAQRVTDTIKEAGDSTNIRRNVDRSRLWSVQTPQTFQLPVILRALSVVRERSLAITDDTAACEAIGQPVRLVEGREPNPKATSPADLPYLEWLLSRPQS